LEILKLQQEKTELSAAYEIHIEMVLLLLVDCYIALITTKYLQTTQAIRYMKDRISKSQIMYEKIKRLRRWSVFGSKRFKKIAKFWFLMLCIRWEGIIICDYQMVR